MIYFDNAATGGFKIRAATDAAQTVMKYLSANPGRSGHRLSVAGAGIVHSARQVLADFFGAQEERVIFTKNCTEALNLAIFGTLKKGGHVITTVYEHNSVLRPLNFLKSQGLIQLDVVSPEPDIVTAIENKIKDDTYLVVMTAVSNVTGEELPVMDVAYLCEKKGILFIVDGAQGGGHVELSVSDGISMLALAGHKGLGGIMGSGALILSDNTDVSPLIHGGTGSESFNLLQPESYPERLEAGTLNLPAIAALSEGAKFVKDNLSTFSEHLIRATDYMISALKSIKNTMVYSRPNRSGIVAFKLLNMPSALVSDLLSSEYDVAVRGGYHCAPLMHVHLGSADDGLVRASLAVQNSTRETAHFIRAVKDLSMR